MSSKFNIPFWKNELPIEVLELVAKEVAEIVVSGPYVGGQSVRDFEALFSREICDGHPVSVANGLQAIEIAIRALGLKKNAKIGVPTHTFIATWFAVLNANCIPVPIEVDMNGQMSLVYLATIAHRLDAVIPVHMHGAGVKMNELLQIARLNNLKVIEDASQAHGLLIGDKRAGEFGDAGAFSLYPTKNIGAVGDAGIIVFKDKNAAEIAWSIANYGTLRESKYIHERIGTNSRLDPIQVPVLSASIRNLSNSIEAKRLIALKYLVAVEQNPVLHPLEKDLKKSTWHHFPILVSNREKFMSKAKHAGINCEIHYPNAAVDEINKITGKFGFENSNASKIASQIVSIPLYSKLTNEEIEHITNFLQTYEELS
jgi:dTDP-4-amino-4,6-dideoxygalactose transaminase